MARSFSCQVASITSWYVLVLRISMRWADPFTSSVSILDMLLIRANANALGTINGINQTHPYKHTHSHRQHNRASTKCKCSYSTISSFTIHVQRKRMRFIAIHHTHTHTHSLRSMWYRMQLYDDIQNASQIRRTLSKRFNWSPTSFALWRASLVWFCYANNIANNQNLVLSSGSYFVVGKSPNRFQIIAVIYKFSQWCKLECIEWYYLMSFRSFFECRFWCESSECI